MTRNVFISNCGQGCRSGIGPPDGLVANCESVMYGYMRACACACILYQYSEYGDHREFPIRAVIDREGCYINAGDFWC